MTKFRTLVVRESGITIVELLIAAALSALIAGAAMEFYLPSHENWISQVEVSGMQQSLRSSARELSATLRNAGAGLPEGMFGITGVNGNPDTISVRYSATPMPLTVAAPSTRASIDPIYIALSSDLEGFEVGDMGYIYRPPVGPGGFFSVTLLIDSAISGWREVYHEGGELPFDPTSGDVVLKLRDARFWIDAVTDSMHPRLMRDLNGSSQVYAEDISDLQCIYTLTNGSIVEMPTPGDSVVAVDFVIRAQTEREKSMIGQDGQRLKRETTSHVFLRNRPASG